MRVNMQRRSFLKFFWQSALASCGSFVLPSFGMAADAFELALKGQDLIQKQDYSNAIEALKKAVEIDPENDWAFGLLGRAYHGAGKQAEAVSAFRQAVKINPAAMAFQWFQFTAKAKGEKKYIPLPPPQKIQPKPPTGKMPAEKIDPTKLGITIGDDEGC